MFQGAKLIDSLFILTAMAIVVRNGKEVSNLITSLSKGTTGVINVLVGGRTGGY